MYSYTERKQAVETLIKYDMQYSYTIRKIGYPDDRRTLRNWYNEFSENGDLKGDHPKRKSKYTTEQVDAAIEYFMSHGENYTNTIKVMGYPCRYQLQLWLDERYPDRKKRCYTSKHNIEYSKEFKTEATIALCTRSESAEDIADEYDVTRVTLYNWKNELLGKEIDSTAMKKKLSTVDSPDALSEENKLLAEENERLKQENFKLQLENDILVKASEILKKDKGVNLENLTNREKAELINALRDRYRLSVLLEELNISKSSYCYNARTIRNGDKYTDLREKIRTIFTENSGRYGYRRIHYVLSREDVKVSEKVIRRIMSEEQLIVPFVKMKKYSSYQGEITPEVPNLVKRDFHSQKPNQLWLTDITEFHIPAGKIYLSPLIDCFDGLPVSWTIGTSPNADLVNTMLENALPLLDEGDKPIIHSDRGAHYRWPEWIKLMADNGLTRSMSKKGCCADNSACEGFHGRLKNEFFYNVSWQNVSIDEFIKQLDEYLQWYCNKRIKITLNGLSPIEYRRSLGLIA